MTTVATADSNNLVTLLLCTCNNNIDHGVCYYSCMVTIWQDYLQTTCCKLQHVVLHVLCMLPQSTYSCTEITWPGYLQLAISCSYCSLVYANAIISICPACTLHLCSHSLHKSCIKLTVPICMTRLFYRQVAIALAAVILLPYTAVRRILIWRLHVAAQVEDHSSYSW